MAGPERFDHYVERCLYHPTDGFYTSGRGTAGRSEGDFLTSPEVGPLFGAVLARVLDAWWVELGRPDPFVVVDAGAGPGTLLRSIALAEPACLGSLDARSIDPANGDGELGLSGLEGAVIIANELLDNLPFRVLERADHGWLELFVENQTEVLRPLDGEAFNGAGFNGAGPTWPVAEGQRVPVLEKAEEWVQRVLDAGVARLLIFDYGLEETAALANRGDWLRVYRDHQRGDDPLREPGRWDITTDVAFDQLPPMFSLERQDIFLQRWGIDELVDIGRKVWLERAAAPDLEAIRMRSRVTERDALVDPEGLGSWRVAVWQ